MILDGKELDSIVITIEDEAEAAIDEQPSFRTTDGKVVVAVIADDKTIVKNGYKVNFANKSE